MAWSIDRDTQNICMDTTNQPLIRSKKQVTLEDTYKHLWEMNECYDVGW
jgi:hypothetical protein